MLAAYPEPQRWYCLQPHPCPPQRSVLEGVWGFPQVGGLTAGTACYPLVSGYDTSAQDGWYRERLGAHRVQTSRAWHSRHAASWLWACGRVKSLKLKALSWENERTQSYKSPGRTPGTEEAGSTYTPKQTGPCWFLTFLKFIPKCVHLDLGSLSPTRSEANP